MSINEAEPAVYKSNCAWKAFSTWAPCHKVCDPRITQTYFQLGYRLKSKADIFQVDVRDQQQLLYWSIQATAQFVADTVVKLVPQTHKRLLEFALQKKFACRGPIIMILRR